MNKEAAFNQKCAEYMGYDKDQDWIGLWSDGVDHVWADGSRYNPHDDLNQLAEVFDKIFTAYADDPSAYSERDLDGFLSRAYDEGIKQALRDFVTEQLGADNE